MKWFTMLIFILLLFSTVVLADRPSYSFSDEIFKDLPPFPDDFFDIKEKFDQQKVTASQLGKDYYQPEMIPGWDYWSEKVYGNDSISFGNYGVFIYPSRLNVFRVKEGDIFNISAFIYSQMGIRFYQGAHISFYHEEGITINLLYPDSYDILLSPTYPFIRGWMQLLKFEVYVEERKNYTIQILEEKPEDEIDNFWREGYVNYTSGSSLLSQKVPKCKVYLYAEKIIEEEVKEEANLLPTFFSFIIMCLIAIMVIVFAFKVWEDYERHREQK